VFDGNSGILPFILIEKSFAHLWCEWIPPAEVEEKEKFSMNAKSTTLAIVIVVFVLLFMRASAPGQAPDFGYFTLGGDCSADRATGDLYPFPDPYCMVDEGPASVVAGNPVRDPDENQGNDRLNRQTEQQLDNPLRSSESKVDKPSLNRGNGSSKAKVEAKRHDPVSGNAEPTVDIPSIDQGKGSSNPEVDKKHDDPDEGSSNPKIDEKHRDPDDDRSEPKVDRPSNKPRDGQNGDDKPCKKDGRDNANSQCKHNCSSDNPDARSGQKRTTDHHRSGEAHSDGHDKNREKKEE
jgi:hypothetical protein